MDGFWTPGAGEGDAYVHLGNDVTDSVRPELLPGEPGKGKAAKDCSSDFEWGDGEIPVRAGIFASGRRGERAGSGRAVASDEDLDRLGQLAVGLELVKALESRLGDGLPGAHEQHTLGAV